MRCLEKTLVQETLPHRQGRTAAQELAVQVD